MTEAEIYTALRKFYRTKEPDEPERKLTFLVIATAEMNDGSLRVGTALIDPDVPDSLKGLLAHLSMPQQTLIYFRDQIDELMKGPREAAMAICQVRDTIGEEKMSEIVANSSNAEEFSNQLTEALEAKGNGIEKHGTG
jgi:hypothetical protein